MALEEQELSVKGWNWGAPKFLGSMMSFEIDNKPAFEIPLQDVSQATTGFYKFIFTFFYLISGR